MGCRAALSLRLSVAPIALTLPAQKLSSLNLCNNKLYGLDGLSDVVEKAPQVKILNLSKNQVRRGNHLKFGLRAGDGAHRGDGTRQTKVPEGEGGDVECRPQVSLFPRDSFTGSLPVFLS